MALSDVDRRALLGIARASVARELGRETAAEGAGAREADSAEALRRCAGAFVTLRVAGALRGCVGHLSPDTPLADVVARVAVAAARSDPRFPAVTAIELDHAAFEVSVVGPLTAPAVPAGIEIGRHGVVVDDGAHQGLLLPQVAVERGWDVPTLLAETCRKAGLPADAWQRGACVRVFEAEVFGERRAGPGEPRNDCCADDG